MSTRKPRQIVNDSRPKVSVERCQIPTKPPKPRCQTCKLGLIICVDHQIQCRNSAFSACNFCLRYRCETGACKTKICCEDAAARVTEVAELESQLRALQAARSGISAPVSRLSPKVGVDTVRRMMYAVCSLLDTAPGAVSGMPLKAGAHARDADLQAAAPVPGQVSKSPLRDDVAAVPVSPAADVPVSPLLIAPVKPAARVDPVD